MSEDDIDEAFEELRKQVESSDHDPSDLTVVPADEVESLRGERDDFATEAKEPYAEALAAATDTPKAMFMKNEKEELQDEYQRRLEAREESAEEVEEEDDDDGHSIGAELAAAITDPEPETTGDTDELDKPGDNDDDDTAELSGDEMRKAQTIATRINKFEKRGRDKPQWDNAAEEARNDFEELTGVDYDDHEFDLGV